jgi:hypothetical protein
MSLPSCVTQDQELMDQTKESESISPIPTSQSLLAPNRQITRHEDDTTHCKPIFLQLTPIDTTSASLNNIDIQKGILLHYFNSNVNSSFTCIMLYYIILYYIILNYMELNKIHFVYNKILINIYI